MRTCTDKLSRLLREDSDPEMLEIFHEKIESAAILITNDISELGAVVRATILKYVAMDHETFFPLSNVVQESAIRDKTLLNSSGYLSVSQPSTLPSDNEDYVKLFGQEHIQYIHQQYLGQCKTQSNEKHPLWSKLKLDCFDDIPRAPKRISQTIGCAVHVYAKDLANIWNGRILEKAAEYVLRILFRLTLAPKREASHRELVRRLAAKKEEKKLAKKNQTMRSNRSNQRRILYLENKYYQKCENHLTRCQDEEEYEKWQARRYQSQVRLHRINQEWAARLARTQNQSEKLVTSA